MATTNGEQERESGKSFGKASDKTGLARRL
jgi:hypothetical protein